MAVDEAARHQLYTRLEETLGSDPTSTLMSLLPPVGWADVATKDDLRGLESSLRSEMAELRSELRSEMAELRSEMAELRSELRGEMAQLRGEFSGLRGDVAGDLASLESRLTTAMRQQLFAIIGAMVAVSGLTVAAAAAFV